MLGVQLNITITITLEPAWATGYQGGGQFCVYVECGTITSLPAALNDEIREDRHRACRWSRWKEYLQLSYNRLITSVELFDKADANVGTGVGGCTLVSPSERLQQCLLTAVFAEGHIIFGGLAPLPEAGAVAQFGIFGGTEAFRKAHGEAVLIITPTGDIDTTLDLE
jgi:hypothetical protein